MGVSVTSKAASQAAMRLAPRVAELAPGLTTSFVREALHRAIDGIGPLPPAAKAAEAQLAEQHGNVDRGIHEVIENHVRYAGAQGFVTNIGGLITAAVAIPVNITGLALIQCRMVAGIAHLRGYDLDDPRVRNAILVCMLGEESVERPGQQEEAARATDGAGHGAGLRPRSRPDRLRRGRLRADHPGRRQAAGGRRSAGGCRSSAGWSGWARTPTRPGGSGATPTASSCPAPGGSPSAAACPVLLDSQPAHDLLAQPVRRAQVGRARARRCASSQLARAAAPPRARSLRRSRAAAP